VSREPKPFPTLLFTEDFKSIDEFRPEFVKLENYDPHPAIKAELAVVGGYNPKIHKPQS
jgi:thymidylate synthase